MIATDFIRVLALHPGRVTSEAVARFEDDVRADDLW